MSGIRNEAYYLDRSFQAWCMNLGNGCYAFDLDLAGYEGRKPKRGHDQPPQIVCLFEAKCIDSYADYSKAKPARFTGGGGEGTYFGTEALQALAKAAGLPLFLIAYRHYEDPKRLLAGCETLRDIERFGVACLYPDVEEQFTWYTPHEFKQWQIATRKALAALFARQVTQRQKVYIYRDKHVWPAIFTTLGLKERKPWLSPNNYDKLSEAEKSKYIRGDEDIPAVTTAGVRQAPRREGRKMPAKKVVRVR